MEQKSEYVQEVFTEIADSYDQMNDKMTWGMLKGWQKIVMQKTQLKVGDKGLDVCCGTGEMTFQQRGLVGPAGSNRFGFYAEYAGCGQCQAGKASLP